jgi:hypothetical protein
MCKKSRRKKLPTHHVGEVAGGVIVVVGMSLVRVAAALVQILRQLSPIALHILEMKNLSDTSEFTPIRITAASRIEIGR